MRNGNRITKPLGQTSAKWQVLGRIGYQAQTVSAIAHSMGHARQSVQRIADVLVREGLAAYGANPRDKRAQLMSITPKGKDILLAIYAQYGEWQKHISSKLDTTKLATVTAMLNDIATVLEAEEK